MKKNFYSVFMSLFILGSLAVFASCSGKKDQVEKEDTATVQEEPKIKDESTTVEIFNSMPVKGDQADYFRLSGPEGSDTLTVTGVPDGKGISSRGDVRVEAQLTITKSLNDKVERLGDLSLMFLDANHKEITSISLTSADKDVVQAELEKGQPGTVTVIFSSTKFDNYYNQIFTEAKYVQLVGADVTGVQQTERERKAEKAKAAAEEAKSAATSSYSYSSYDSDDDDGYDDDDPKSMKNAYRKAKEKVSTKAKDLKEKAAEKLNNWLDD